MFNKRLLILIIIGLACAAVIRDRQLQAIAANRASMFISIDWLIRREIGSGRGAPESINEIIERAFPNSYEDKFDDGLIYKKINDESYILRQRKSNLSGCFVEKCLFQMKTKNLAMRAETTFTNRITGHSRIKKDCNGGWLEVRKSMARPGFTR